MSRAHGQRLADRYEALWRRLPNHLSRCESQELSCLARVLEMSTAHIFATFLVRLEARSRRAPEEP